MTHRRLLVVAVLLVAVGGTTGLFLVPRSRAQVDITVDASMTKGAPNAAVTIVEFSDYQ